MLETTECIMISNKNRFYTDCMEFSLLRFIQMLTYDSKQILTNKFSYYPEYIECNQDFIDFTNKYPIIYPDAEFYLKSVEGKEQRAKWSEFVSDRDFLDYYRNDGAELFTSVTNIIKFVNGFFSMELDILNQQDSLNLLAQKFSNKDKNISIKIREINITNKSETMENILKYISRSDTEYIKHVEYNELYSIILSITYLDITIDGFDYEWMLYEVYFDNPDLFENKFITGHSVIYNI